MEKSNGVRAICEMKIAGSIEINMLDEDKIKEWVRARLIDALAIVLEEFKEETGEIPTHAYMSGSLVETARKYLNETRIEYNKEHPEEKREVISWDAPVRVHGVLLKSGCTLSGPKVVIVSWKGCEE